MRVSIVLVCSLALLAGCHTETTLQVQAGGKVFLNPNKGDKLTWVDSHHHGLPVTFPYGSPCAEGDNTTTCTINVPSGYFKYKCAGCIDPGIGVGSTSGTALTQDYKPHGTGVNSASTPDPFIYCENGKAAAEKVEASVGDKIQWFGAGEVTAWTVTPAASTCEEAGPINQSSPVCTIKAGATSNPYQVNAPFCRTDPNGTSSITIR
jgi:hypothetical protein